MRVESQPAYILHQRFYRESSQILEIFTRDYGRLSVLSRGSRGARSKHRGLLQPFRLLLLGWGGKGELSSLFTVEPAELQVPMLMGKALASAIYMNELLMRLTHRHDVHEALFYDYHTALIELSTQAKLEPALRIFEKRLLEHLGFGMPLVVDANSGKTINPEGCYVYHLEHGPVLSSASPQRTALPIVSGRSLLALAAGDLSDEQVLRDAKQVMRYVLNYYLGGKPLKSRELFRR